MVHLFQIHGTAFAFDAECGALHEISTDVMPVLEAWQANGGERPDAVVLSSLSSHLGVDANQISDEIAQLVEAGHLFAPRQEVQVDQLYPTQPRVKAMCLLLCNDCNLRCKYCFAGEGDYGLAHRERLSFATGKAAFDFLIEASGNRQNLDVDFFGGEPLLNWQVVQGLVHYARQLEQETGRSLRLTLTTNGSLLTEDKFDFINQHFKNVVLSLDGRPEVHNQMRPDCGGGDSYDRCATNIKNFIQSRGDREYYLRGTYTHHNLDFDADVCHLATLGDQISIEPVVAPQEQPYAILPEDIDIIMESYQRLAQTMASRREQGTGFNFFHFQIDLGAGPCAFKRLKGCGVGTEYVAVTPDGSIYPCHQLIGDEQYYLGSVLNHDSPLDLTKQEQFRRLLTPHNEECQTCFARYFCGGGCVANAIHATGSMQGLDSQGCQLLKTRLECALWLEFKRRSALAQS